MVMMNTMGRMKGARERRAGMVMGRGAMGRRGWRVREVREGVSLGMVAGREGMSLDGVVAD
jgi:hypothetical protein